jgi:hypothetical protein
LTDPLVYVITQAAYVRRNFTDMVEEHAT